MSRSGTFSTPSVAGNWPWSSAFLNSPERRGSNYSYTSPAIPPGTYTVKVRAVDVYGRVQQTPKQVTVTVSEPAGNAAPVASATVSCDQNVCALDGWGSTDESPTSLTYSWNYGNGRTCTGPVPTHNYTTPGTFTVTLTVKDQYGVTGATTLDVTTLAVTIVEPAGNQAPTPVINPPSCTGLVCNLTGAATDPNTGDRITYTWNYGDGTPLGSGSSVNHTFPAAGTYMATLTATDGWGKANSVTREVTVTGSA